jgi:hypothetical protein
MTAVNKICSQEICYCCDRDVDDLKRVRLDTKLGKILLCSIECFKQYMAYRERQKKQNKKEAKCQ